MQGGKTRQHTMQNVDIADLSTYTILDWLRNCSNMYASVTTVTLVMTTGTSTNWKISAEGESAGAETVTCKQAGTSGLGL